MQIPVSLLAYTNLFIAALLLVVAFLGYRSGLFLQLYSLINVFIKILIAYIFAPLFASVFKIYAIDLGILNESSLQTLLSKQMNTIIWFVLIYIALTVTLMILKPFIKGVSKVPVLKGINRFLGLILGLVKGLVYVVLLIGLLSTPLIKNGQDVIDASILKHVEAKLPFVYEQFNEWQATTDIFSFLLDGNGLKDADKDAIISWLEKQKDNLADLDKIKEDLDKYDE